MKNLWIRWMLLMIVITGSAARAESTLSPEAAAENRILARYSLDQMAAARNVFRVALTDEDVCGVKPASARAQLPQLLEALIVEKKREFALDAWKKDSAPLENCLARCRCGFYADLADEKSGEAGVPAELKSAVAKARALEKKEDARRLACARNNRWVCTSPLLKHLLAQTAHE